MAGPPPSGTPPPPPMSTPPLWMPASPPPGMMSHRSMMSTVSFLFRVLGFTLLFVAALIAVTWGYPGGSCFPSSGTGTTPCTHAGSAYVTGAANAILTGHILFAIGAFMLGIGAGIKIHFGLQSKAGADREENRWIIADRLFNGLVFLVSVWILFALLTGVTINLLL